MGNVRNLSGTPDLSASIKRLTFVLLDPRSLPLAFFVLTRNAPYLRRQRRSVLSSMSTESPADRGRPQWEGGERPVAVNGGLLVNLRGDKWRWSPKRKHAVQRTSPEGNTPLTELRPPEVFEERQPRRSAHVTPREYAQNERNGGSGPPEVLEARRGEVRVAHRMLDVTMPKVSLQRPRVVPSVG